MVKGRKGRKAKDGKGLTGYKGTSSSKANSIIFIQAKVSHFREIAAINVTNVDLIEEFVFSAAFSTFDQVEGWGQGKMNINYLWLRGMK